MEPFRIDRGVGRSINVEEVTKVTDELVRKLVRLTFKPFPSLPTPITARVFLNSGRVFLLKRKTPLLAHVFARSGSAQMKRCCSRWAFSLAGVAEAWAQFFKG